MFGLETGNRDADTGLTVEHALWKSWEIAMSKYADVARQAATLARGGIDPSKAWEAAALNVFPSQPASRAKGCPKCAFLGLAEDGKIKGVPSGHYTNSRLNKQYAIDALKAIRGRPSLVQNADELWQAVMRGADKKHNEQMHVVIALWEANDLV